MDQSFRRALKASESTGQLSNASQSSASPRRGNGWNEVLEICNKSFSNKMSGLGQEMLRDLRAELQQTVDTLRKEMESQFDAHKTKEDASFAKLAESMKKVVDVAECSFLGVEESTSRMDLRPVIEELRSNELVHSEGQRTFHQQLEKDFAVVTENFQKLTIQAEAGEERVRKMTLRINDLETHLVKLSEAQAAQFSHSHTMADEVKRVESQSKQERAMISDKLDSLCEQLSHASEIQKISRDLSTVSTRVTRDHTVVLQEIGKIQEALHLDFVQRKHEREAEEEMRAFERMNLGIAEFITFFRENAHFVQKVSLTTGIPEYELRHLEDADLQKWFGEMDTDGSGTLDFKEFIDGINVVVEAMKAEEAGGKRVRAIWTQTNEIEGKNKSTQTDPKLTSDKRKRSVKHPAKKAEAGADGGKTAFQDADALKKKARAALISKPPYNVFDYYHRTGCAQKIATNQYFEYATLFVVILNAIWMSIDSDNNKAAFLNSAEPVFVVVENLFCVYFLFELIIRFAAFEHKCNCCKDASFCFDLLLMSLMILETWIVPIIFIAANFDPASSGMVDLSFVKMVKLVKLMRLSRLTKLLRSVPELVIIVKGLGFAARSVAVFFLLWIVIIYIFAILLKELTSDTAVGSERFSSVPDSMNTLLLAGIIPDQTDIVNDMGKAGWYLWPIIVSFIFLCSMTLMYMLVGVLVDVVKVIASSEIEAMNVSFLASSLREKMDELGYSLEAHVEQAEFGKFITQPEIARIIAGAGVDVVVMMDMMDVIYEDLEKNGSSGLSFENIVDIILNMRGANPATVKDVKEQLRVTKRMVAATEHKLLQKMAVEFASLHHEIKLLAEDADNRHADEEELAMFYDDDEEEAQD
eukprot:TRINITY_DN12363_c0_g1_i1.p1 TRINITY_DN12363_c0_g1~~TRINITY_DN12363_c0_g1_i1.p1  ORF type:complete len:869 (-),score=186.52 TRINITY_DN12363_c0_g1_i1:160-2766(-)